MMSAIFDWVVHHGYLGIYGLLAIGVVALPAPEDAVLIVAGSLVARGQWSFAPTWTAACAGCITGITISYLLGRIVGLVVINRFGADIGMTPARSAWTEAWFHRVGKWSFLPAYFIPGIRHLVAIIAGASHLRFPVFALFAWSGAFIWSTTFLSLGYWLGEEWHRAEGHLRLPQLALLVALSAGAVLIWLLRRRNQTQRRVVPDNRIAASQNEAES